MAVKKWTCFDGVKHPVSTEFIDKIKPDLDLETLSYARLQNELTGLLAIANGDPLDGGRELDAAEKHRLDAIVHVINLNRALHFMKGRDYREVFGAGATLDQVHGNAITKDCGCVLQVMFDHNKRHEANVKAHPHHSHKACADHAHLKDDFHAHHKAFEG